MKLSTKQAAEILEVNECRMRKWRSTGKGPAYTKNTNARVTYEKADVLKWQKQNTKKVKAGLPVKIYKRRKK